MEISEKDKNIIDTKPSTNKAIPDTSDNGVAQVQTTLSSLYVDDPDASRDLEEGQATLGHLLSLINRPSNRTLYSAELLAMLLDTLRIPNDKLLDITASLAVLRKYKLTSEQAKKLTQYMRSSPVLIERNFSLREFEALSTSSPEVYKKREKLLRAKDTLATYDRIEFTLFTDGQELVTVEKDNQKYVLREFKTSLSSHEIATRFKQEIPGLPKTDIHITEETIDQNHHVLALTQKVPREINNSEQIIDLSRQLVESIGFVVDLNDQNFMQDEGGNVYYVDGDLVEYLITSPTLAVNDRSRDAVEKEITEYSLSGKRVKIAA
jgi:hypothetical protein